MQVAQIEELDKRRVRVHLEDGRDFALYKGEVRKLGLTKGEELSLGQYEEIQNGILAKRAKKRALHLLARMDRTEAQLRQKLRQGYYTEEAIEEAVSYVKGLRYLDDARYARNFVRCQKGQKSQGNMRMALLSKGIPRKLAEQALEEECGQETEQELILRWVEKKHYSKETADRKEKQRMYQFLLRKGFRSNEILHVLDYLT